jgi:hypothetical protein
MFSPLNKQVEHIRDGSVLLCQRRDAPMAITVEEYRARDGAGRYCVRCLTRLAIMEATARHRAGQEPPGPPETARGLSNLALDGGLWAAIAAVGGGA